MRIKYSQRAQYDLSAVSSYLKMRSPAAANAVVTTIESRVAKLADNPLIGTLTDESGTRELVVLRYPYKVYYRIKGDLISILHVRDARRRPWRNRP
jgi:plasmid stabilization system protein ParE